jgi:ubiquinone/menaquinone biosynthesis C-methylase UbiE
VGRKRYVTREYAIIFLGNCRRISETSEPRLQRKVHCASIPASYPNDGIIDRLLISRRQVDILQPTRDTGQNKHKEIDFFDRSAELDEYNVFTDAANEKLISAFSRLSRLPAGSHVADLGCGSGVFTSLLHQSDYEVVGLDISAKQISIARAKHPEIKFFAGDVENLPFVSEGLDGVLLSGVVHHLPDPRRCAAEVFRVLRPGGRFVAFDPNRRNPFMWLYRDRHSPFYSKAGVTENEQPVVAENVRDAFSAAGLNCQTEYLSGLAYRYVASSIARAALPAYNLIDAALFRPDLLKRYRAFVLTYGGKQ